MPSSYKFSPVSHASMSASKRVQPEKVDEKEVTDDVFQADISALNASQPQNMLVISVTEDASTQHNNIEEVVDWN